MFRRRVSEPANPSNPITDFWAWWSTAAPRFRTAIENGQYGDLTDEMTTMVKAMAPGLEWELSAGVDSAHALCVTCAGNPDFRAAAHRWWLAAPARSDDWEYHSSRSANPDAVEAVVKFEGISIALAEARFHVVIDDSRELADVAVHHPGFAVMDERQARHLTYLLMDWLLGENVVERWIGVLETAVSLPADTIPADALGEVIDALRSRHSEPTWALLQGATPEGHRVIAMTQRPLKPVEHPLFELHAAIACAYAERTDDGLPAPAALDQLRRIEDDFSEAFAGEVFLAAVVSVQGVRTLHVYCDPQSQTPARIDAWVGKLRGVSLAWDIDPAWDAVAPFR